MKWLIWKCKYAYAYITDFLKRNSDSRLIMPSFIFSCRSPAWSGGSQPGGEARGESQEFGYADTGVRGFLRGAGHPLPSSRLTFLPALRDGLGHQRARSPGGGRGRGSDRRVEQSGRRVQHKRGAALGRGQGPEEEQGSSSLSCLQSHGQLRVPTGST